MSWYTVAWLAWAAIFALVEGKALASKQPGDTLSEHVWAWFHVRDPRPTGLVWVLRSVLLIALTWLFLHLGFGWLSF
jgi:hypothetical protein